MSRPKSFRGLWRAAPGDLQDISGAVVRVEEMMAPLTKRLAEKLLIQPRNMRIFVADANFFALVNLI